MTDVELDERVTALEENGNYDHVNSKGDDSFISFILYLLKISKVAGNIKLTKSVIFIFTNLSDI